MKAARNLHVGLGWHYNFGLLTLGLAKRSWAQSFGD